MNQQNNTLLSAVSAFGGAVFDLDGTLLDSMHVWENVDRDFLKIRGLPDDAEYCECIKQMSIREAADYTISRYGLSDTPDELIAWWMERARRAYHEEVLLKDGACEYLLYLKKKNVRLSVATACEPELYIPALKRLGIYELFGGFASLREVTRGKRHPDIYLLAAERIGIKPSDCIVFDDILDGVFGAKAGGMTTVGVYDDSSKEQRAEIEDAADYYIESFRELIP